MEANKSASMFPNIERRLKILCIIPDTTATSGRSFSSLIRNETNLGSTINQNRFNGLAMVHVDEADISVKPPEEVLDMFAKKTYKKTSNAY